jgi:hypothetical protein
MRILYLIFVGLLVVMPGPLSGADGMAGGLNNISLADLTTMLAELGIQDPEGMLRSMPGYADLLPVDHDDAPGELNAELDKKVEAASAAGSIFAVGNNKKDMFYEGYIEQYFPRALVIRSQFLANMPLQDLDQALDDLVTVFKTNPEFYFSNDVARIKIGFYWESVVDQLSLVSEFLKKAYYDPRKQEIFLLEPLRFGMGSTQMNCTFLRASKKQVFGAKPLITVLADRRLTAIGRFYATYFDYTIKLFNEAILFKEVMEAQRYLRDLEFIVTKLSKTEFERMYQEPIKTCRDLLSILQSHLASLYVDDNAEYDEDDPSYDASRAGWGGY